jgi:hypothetical protein
MYVLIVFSGFIVTVFDIAPLRGEERMSLAWQCRIYSIEFI